MVHLQLRQAPAQTATVEPKKRVLANGIPHAMLSSAGSAKRSVNASVCSAKRASTKRPHPTLQQHALPSPRVMPNSNSWGIPERMPATAQLAHTDQPRARAPPAAMLPNALISCAAPANTLVQMHAPRVQTGNTKHKLSTRAACAFNTPHAVKGTRGTRQKPRRGRAQHAQVASSKIQRGPGTQLVLHIRHAMQTNS